MKCSRSQNLILEGIDHPLPDVQGHELEMHLQSCADCREFQRRQLEWDALLGDRLARVQTPPGLAERIFARVHAEAKTESARSREDRRRALEAEFERWRESSRRGFERSWFGTLLDLLGLGAIILAIWFLAPGLVTGSLERLGTWMGGHASAAPLAASIALTLAVLGIVLWTTVRRGLLAPVLHPGARL